MALEKSNLSEAPADRKLVLTRVFDAPRSLVFACWAEREHMNKWGAPRGFTVPESSGDFRVGGKWHCLMIDPGGGKHLVRGVYREIVTDERIVTTHGWDEDDGSPGPETILQVTFADEPGGKTRMTLEQAVFSSVESRNGHEGGWGQCLDILGELLAKLQGRS
jgi:uncharacterized protein YndB with AHSA1/START domain